MEAVKLLKQYFLADDQFSIQPIKNGLINATFEVNDISQNKKFILQKINTHIFTQPEAIVENHLTINQNLLENAYPKRIISIVPNLSNELLTYDEDGNAWRMMDYVENSKTLVKVNAESTAEKAAKAFGDFYWHLNQNPIQLQEVLPHFLDFQQRMNDFENAIQNAESSLKQNAQMAIDYLVLHKDLPQQWIFWQKNNILPQRIIHADPKISNILFDANDNPLAIIDLDTAMNATLLYDFGDMVRSYTNLLNEDSVETDNNFAPEIYSAVKRGFLQPLATLLTPLEIENLDYAAQVVIYIQAVRFLTDYLNGSTYYSTRYELQNLDRTYNQIHLLKGLKNHLALNQ